jgi:transketolase
MKLLLIFFTMIFAHQLMGQGRVVFSEPDKVKMALNTFIMKNKANSTIKGWRIQILSTTDRKEMENTRSRFMASHPTMPNNWKHISPYYQIRVGAYRTKEEMQQVLYELKREYPASIGVQDDIEKYDLINF